MSPENSQSEDRNAPEPEDLPSTLQRSDAKAQRTYAEALSSAEEQYDDEARAHQTAWAAVKRTHEKVGDHWEPKDEPGPSDERSEGEDTRSGETAGGVDANASKEHLYEIAQRLEIEGRSEMSKDELVTAIRKANDRESARARED
ncbi:cation transport regulator ChaB [Kocuria coralli]|uniref:Cation transport regulator ChaB n=1 Tax=Kocuria coralli TaxID=1461025 RepID=A0A5J5KYF6_9MICC|nr:ChaB family protein [Kocuria coralli]KAA9393771.1 cation transport regulator ChaB [Kocuria coralli]